MRLRPWMMLLVLLSGRRLSAVDVNRLTQVVRAIRTEYRIDGQFCLAANIPLNQNQGSLDQILQNNRYQQFSGTLEEGGIYESDSIIVAKHTQGDPVHAERQVLSKLPRLRRNRQGNFLLVYSYLSPCRKCTDWNQKYNIVRTLYNSVLDWDDAAFVFTTVYSQPPGAPAVTREVLENSLYDLGESMGGLNKVYRCYGPTNLQLACHSCSIRDTASEVCLSNNAGQGGSSRQRSQSESSSRSGSDTSRRGSDTSRRGSDTSSSGSDTSRSQSSGSSSNISRKRVKVESPRHGSTSG
ncbi:uncharacterized protein PAE49_006108 [Odontesthes bonariensis]|uniref:uncharacterized protein LOC142381769 n=1 Tax=Odontesthes bonariensis TaxID=219752 RepID=UPI003F58A150